MKKKFRELNGWYLRQQTVAKEYVGGMHGGVRGRGDYLISPPARLVEKSEMEDVVIHTQEKAGRDLDQIVCHCHPV